MEIFKELVSSNFKGILENNLLLGVCYLISSLKQKNIEVFKYLQTKVNKKDKSFKAISTISIFLASYHQNYKAI